jgi:hypothetical protein
MIKHDQKTKSTMTLPSFATWWPMQQPTYELYTTGTVLCTQNADFYAWFGRAVEFESFKTEVERRVENVV